MRGPSPAMRVKGEEKKSLLIKVRIFPKKLYLCALKIVCTRAGVAELVDALDLGSSFSRSKGSSPFIRTSYRQSIK